MGMSDLGVFNDFGLFRRNEERGKRDEKRRQASALKRLALTGLLGIGAVVGDVSMPKGVNLDQDDHRTRVTGRNRRKRKF